MFSGTNLEVQGIFFRPDKQLILALAHVGPANHWTVHQQLFSLPKIDQNEQDSFPQLLVDGSNTQNPVRKGKIYSYIQVLSCFLFFFFFFIHFSFKTVLSLIQSLIAPFSSIYKTSNHIGSMRKKKNLTGRGLNEILQSKLQA